MKSSLIVLTLLSICYSYPWFTRRSMHLKDRSTFKSYRQVAKPHENDNFDAVALAIALLEYSDLNKDYLLSEEELQLLFMEVYQFNSSEAAGIARKLITFGDMNGDSLLDLPETVRAMERAQDLFS